MVDTIEVPERQTPLRVVTPGGTVVATLDENGLNVQDNHIDGINWLGNTDGDFHLSANGSGALYVSNDTGSETFRVASTGNVTLGGDYVFGSNGYFDFGNNVWFATTGIDLYDDTNNVYMLSANQGGGITVPNGGPNGTGEINLGNTRIYEDANGEIVAEDSGGTTTTIS